MSLNFYAPFIYGDEFVYDSLAQNMLDGKLYAKIGGSFPPGYPIFLSLAELVSNDKNIVYHTMLALSAIFTTSIIYPSFFILKKYCSVEISILGAFTVTILPFLNFYSFTIMTEALFVSLFLYSLWFLIMSYETNSKKWEIMASLSIVYLYITRANGLAMIISFILTFIFYIATNSKQKSIFNKIWEKKFLLVTFIVFLGSWIIFSTYVTDISKPLSSQTTSSYHLGSSYNIVETQKDIYSSIINFDVLLYNLKLLVNDINYLFISSSFFILIVIFLLILYYSNRQLDLSTPIFTSFVYMSISLILLIGSTVDFISSTNIGIVIIGRYIDPMIPSIIIFGIIGIYNLKNINKKVINYFVIVYVALLFFILYTLIYDNTIIYGFGNIVNNPALYAFTMFYGPEYNSMTLFPATVQILPAALIILYFLLLLFFLYITFENKNQLYLLMIFMILSSIVFSSAIYQAELLQSNYSRGNDIGVFLNSNTNRSTLLYIDARSNLPLDTNGYCFWNKGSIGFIDPSNMTRDDIIKNKTAYLLSSHILSYKEVASNGSVKLYQI